MSNSGVPTAHEGYRQKMHPAMWNQITRAIASKHHVTLPRAEQMLDGAIGFLQLCANNPEKQFSPSPAVDDAWHVFLLHTRLYAQFCHEVLGTFIHHDPCDESNEESYAGLGEQTVAFMREHNVPFDPGVWHLSRPRCCGAH